MKVLCTCGKYHDFEKEECSMCIPPKNVFVFGRFHIDSIYREALYQDYPFYSVEEIVGSYIGNNPNFPSYNTWNINPGLDKLEESFDLDEEKISAWTTSESENESD